MEMVGLVEAPNPSSLPGQKGCERWALAEAESWITRQRVVLAEGHSGSAPGRIISHRTHMATIDTSSLFASFEGIAKKVADEKNLVPAILSGLTFGMFSYVALKGKTIRKARDIVDDIVTGMAGTALKDIAGGGTVFGALSMFVPAYAEVGDLVADSVITVADGGSEDDIVADGDIMIAAGAIALVTAVAYLFVAPYGDGPITSRLFGGE